MPDVYDAFKNNLNKIILFLSAMTLFGWFIGTGYTAFGLFFGFIVGWLNLFALDWTLNRVFQYKEKKAKLITIISYPFRWSFLILFIYGVVLVCGRTTGIAFAAGMLSVKPVFLITLFPIKKATNLK